MDITSFVVLALGMQPEDVLIESFDANIENLSANLTIRQQRQSCRCISCGGQIYGVKQWRKKSLWGIPLGVFQRVKVIFYQLQGICGDCNKARLAKAKFIHPNLRKMTTAFAEYAGRWMEETTCAAVERMTDCPAMSLWRLDQWRMKKMKKDFKFPSDLPLSLASADEVHQYTDRPKDQYSDKSQWDRKFVTNLVSYDLSKVLTNANGRSARSLGSCLKQLGPELRKQIKFLAVDMHDGYIKAAEKYCPNAKVTVDRFHVAEALNRAFDEVRKNEFEKAKESKDLFQKQMLMPSKRFILVEREKSLSSKDKKHLHRLRELNQNINSAMLMVEYFHKILDKTKVDGFRKGLKLWEELVTEAELTPFMDFLNTVKKYQDRIEVYIRSRLTTAVSEGINNKIKVLKRVGYTYTNETSFKNKILQRCGLLNSRNISTNHWYWHVT